MHITGPCTLVMQFINWKLILLFLNGVIQINWFGKFRLSARFRNWVDKAVNYVVYLNLEGQKFDTKNPENIFTITRDKRIVFKPNSRKLQRKYEVRISALDRLHNESEITKVKVIKL